jgi:hypothetical protein
MLHGYQSLSQYICFHAGLMITRTGIPAEPIRVVIPQMAASAICSRKLYAYNLYGSTGLGGIVTIPPDCGLLISHVANAFSR